MKRFASFSFLTLMILTLASLFSVPTHGLENVAVRVAVLDTGISVAAIKGKNLDVGRNYILPNAPTEDITGHGTAVAAIIVGSEAAGVSGLCPEATMVPLVYYSKTEENQTAKGDLAMLAQMIRDAVDVYHCRIINISSGAGADTPALRDAVAWAEQRGALVVSCAGNDSDGTAYFPGAFPTVLCVGTANAEENGPALFSNRHSGVDLLAPGARLPTANAKGESVTASGTSFSAAWVTGAAAALLTMDPGLTPYELRQLLCSTTRDVCSGGYDTDSGWGIVDLSAAMLQLQEERGKPLPFGDVEQDAYYRSAVVWALKNGITGGITSTAFAPDMTCTRAQAVTLLWRAAGCPEPRVADNPFVDVVETDYFYKAVLWAVEKGVTSGTSDTAFSPRATCSEAQIVTFVWRAQNRPAAEVPSEAAAFGGHYYADAAAWADTYGIFAVGQAGFEPIREATRARIVMYLYHSAAGGWQYVRP